MSVPKQDLSQNMVVPICNPISRENTQGLEANLGSHSEFKASLLARLCLTPHCKIIFRVFGAQSHCWPRPFHHLISWVHRTGSLLSSPSWNPSLCFPLLPNQTSKQTPAAVVAAAVCLLKGQDVLIHLRFNECFVVRSRRSQHGRRWYWGTGRIMR